MNYEEMLDHRDGMATHQEKIPLGMFCKKLIEKKYRNVVELRSDLTDNIVFCEALKADAQFTAGFRNRGQLHFTLKENDNAVCEIELEQGSYLTMSQMLENNPAVVAGKDFIDRVVEQMAQQLRLLHDQQVYQLCLAPENIFVRKNDNMPLLLCHGSFYSGMSNMGELFGDFVDAVAPEVLSDGVVGERQDVYALGKLIERLFETGNMDLVYKRVVRKATALQPEERYATVADLMADLESKRKLLRSVLAFVAALAIALGCVWIYAELMPEPVSVEFVGPSADYENEDPFATVLQPDELLIDDPDDSLAMGGSKPVKGEDLSAMSADLFRRQFTREAERVLSKIYSREKMNSSEQTFISSSTSLMDELMQKRDELADQAGLTPEEASKIAGDIVNKIRTEKQKMLKSYGVQK